MLRNTLRALALSAALPAVVQSASATELGDIISASRVGASVRVEIELAAADGRLPEQSSCFSLVSDPPNPDRLPVLANGRATLRTLEGRHSVIISSNQPVGETAVLGLRLGCGFDARRNYVLRLPPPELAQAPIAESRRPAEVPLQEPIVEAPAFESQQKAPAKLAPPRKPIRAAARPRADGDRLALSLSESDEALSRRLAAPVSGPADYRAAGAEAVALNARLSELEATVARLRAELAASTPTAEPGRAIAAQREIGPPHVPTAAPVDGALAVVPRSLKPDAAEESGYSMAWLLAFAAGGALLTLAAVALARRWSLRRSAGEDAAAPAPVTVPGAAPAAVDADAQGEQGPHTIEVSEPKSPLELAEFMLSFGRVDEAAMALEEYIANNPRGAIEPWHKLLEIYRQVGRRHAFDALARRMHRTFDVPAPSWEASPGEVGAR